MTPCGHPERCSERGTPLTVPPSFVFLGGNRK